VASEWSDIGMDMMVAAPVMWTQAFIL